MRRHLFKSGFGARSMGVFSRVAHALPERKQVSTTVAVWAQAIWGQALRCAPRDGHVPCVVLPSMSRRAGNTLGDPAQRPP